MKIEKKPLLCINDVIYSQESRNGVPLILNDAGELFATRGRDGRLKLPSEHELEEMITTGFAQVLPARGGEHGRSDGAVSMPKVIRSIVAPPLMPAAGRSAPDTRSTTRPSHPPRPVVDEIDLTAEADESLTVAAIRALVVPGVTASEAYADYRSAIFGLNDRAGGHHVHVVDESCFRRRMRVIRLVLNATSPEVLQS